MGTQELLGRRQVKEGLAEPHDPEQGCWSRESGLGRGLPRGTRCHPGPRECGVVTGGLASPSFASWVSTLLF